MTEKTRGLFRERVCGLSGHARCPLEHPGLPAGPPDLLCHEWLMEPGGILSPQPGQLPLPSEAWLGCESVLQT